MVDNDILNDVGETLKAVLVDGGFGLTDNDIVLALPKKDGPQKKLIIFIFQVSEAAEMRNMPPEITPDDVVKPAPMYLVVDLLIIPSMPEDDETKGETENLRLAGKVLATFHNRPIIRSPYLKGSLAKNDAELRVILRPLSLDDLTKLWSSFADKAFQFSLCYRVYNVPLVSAPGEAGVPVSEFEARYGEKAEE
jgi:hypothetical protein